MSLAGTAITGTGKARFAKGFNYGAQGGCEGDICGVNEFARINPCLTFGVTVRPVKINKDEQKYVKLGQKIARKTYKTT